jgi:hypothetical protein
VENFGGPVWHASARSFAGLRDSKRLAWFALKGVGDVTLGGWEGEQGRGGIWHVQLRLTDAEREQFGVPEPIDIRGTARERERIQAVFAETPRLRSVLA